jgi:hypothetical protein
MQQAHSDIANLLACNKFAATHGWWADLTVRQAGV